VFVRTGVWIAMVSLSLTAAVGDLAAADLPAARLNQADHRHEAGLAALKKGDFATAEREFRAAITLEPLMVLAHYGLGQTFMGLKRYPDAVRAYTDAQRAYRQIAMLETTDGRFDDRIQRYQDSLEGWADGMGTAGNAEARDEKIRRQETRKRRSQTWEMPAELSLALGSAYYRTGDLDAAEREYRSAIKVRAGLGEAHNNLAVVYMKQGKLREAQEELARAEKEGFAVSPQLKQDLAGRVGKS
jgi:Flp pilus assembly protein TadD